VSTPHQRGKYGILRIPLKVYMKTKALEGDVHCLHLCTDVYTKVYLEKIVKTI